MGNRSSRRRGTLAVLLLVILLLSGSVGSAARPTSAGHPFVTANGIALQAGQPLPIFTFASIQVDPLKDTLPLAQRFEGIYELQPVFEDVYGKKPRYTVPNTRTLTLLEQYGATGGFFAFRTGDLVTETPRGAVDLDAAQLLACRFLLDNNFIAGDGSLLIGQNPQTGFKTPNIRSCNFDPQPDPPYVATPILAAVQDAQGVALAATQTVGVVIQAPINLETGRYSQIPSVPLGGAGGHISLLFSTTDPEDKGFSLDQSTPGLMAAALPFYGRSARHLRNAPAVDPVAVKQQVTDQVRAAYPSATNIVVPDPELLYMVGDAGEEQRALEPMLNFEGISLTVDGATVVLKDIAAPAVEAGTGATGFGPTVAITAPANGSAFAPNSDVTLTGAISAGTGPYTYQWFLSDGTPLGDAATIANPGSVTTRTKLLPVVSRDGSPQPTSVVLWVQDSEGAVREATVSLVPAVAPAAYLPLVLRGGGGLMAMQQPAPPATNAELAASNYTFGIESGSDYPPYGAGGADLPGVIPDANGFRSQMLSYGWTQRFYWSNASAWERDWRDCSLGGIDCSLGVDRADFVYYAGHGGPGGISLPSNKDSSWFAAENGRFQVLRWVGFASCQTLRAQPNTSAAPIRRWFNSFRGSHMLLGFNSNMADIAFGPRLVNNMRIPTFLGIEFPWAQMTIREAWVLTAFEMNAGKPAYIYAVGSNGVNPVNNRLPRPSDAALPRPFPVASYHWVWWNE